MGKNQQEVNLDERAEPEPEANVLLIDEEPDPD
jgi:hypothetical protein